MDHLEQRGLEAEVHGLPPRKSIDLEMYKGQSIPTNWDIIGTTGNILMVEMADEVADGELIDRGGILVNAGVSKEMWRIAKIVLAGPGSSEQCKVGTYILFPNDRGLSMTKFDGHNYVFINEERIFCFVKPKTGK